VHPVPLPAELEQIVEDFAAAPDELRTELLLELSDTLPPLPEGLDSSAMEQVEECQTPFFLSTWLDDGGRVRLAFDAPPQAPTTRGFAGILARGLDGATPEEVLAVEDDFHDRLGLARLISPLRMRGMAAILHRLKRQVRSLAGAP
jgi:cysteine desulfuration protein SufE